MYYVRIYGKDHLFTFNKDNFVARIGIGKLKGLDFTKPLVKLGKDFLEKIIITKILEDELLNERDDALKRFLQNANSAHAEDLFQFGKILEGRFSSKFQNQNISILNEIIDNIYISKEFKDCAKRLLYAEQLLLERNSKFPKFDPNIQPNLSNLLYKLKAICKEGISNHRKLLLRKCPSYRHSLSGLMTQSIFGLYNQKVLYLSDKDIQLFSDLTTLTDSKYLEQLWRTLFSKVQQENGKSLKDIGPLTNPIYLHLFKSLQELITEISNTVEIPKEDLLKVDSAGNWSVLGEGSIKWGDKSSHITCSIEQQYRFIFKLMGEC